MVYFKLNSLIIDLVRVTGMNLSQIACSRYCSRQVISYESMTLILKQLVYLRAQNAKEIAEFEKTGKDDSEKESGKSRLIKVGGVSTFSTRDQMETKEQK